MWLLNTDRLGRLELVEFSEEFTPNYAILSHTWGEEEVTFQDIQAISSRQWPRVVSQAVSTIQAKKGFDKIRNAAALAAAHGYHFIWVDTCCIDKASSAELSEAINSMFRWYKKASICYAYLEDVKYGYHDSKGGLFHILCQHSRWFTRGWTLQELIAPEDVMFYGGDWGYLGSKAHDEDVRISLSDLTGIDVRVLEGTIQPSEMSIATRMKWASQRETTRLEDVAYCLMGLFDVNMPLLYGEGKKAFIRLQEEILKDSNDHSIFTWKAPNIGSNEVLWGLLAETPQYFAYVENYRPMPPLVSEGSTAWSITNQGLRLSLFLIPSRDWADRLIEDEYDCVLQCVIRYGDEAYLSPAIQLKRLYGDQFARIEPQTVKRVATPSFDPSFGKGSYSTIFVKQNPIYAAPDFMVSFSNIRPSSRSQVSDPSCYITGVWPERHWDEEAATLHTIRPHSDQVIGLFRFYSATLLTTVDFAIGLRRRPGGSWSVWHLQRPSTGEPLHQTALSVNQHLSPGRQNLAQPTVSNDWLQNPWNLVKENQQIRIQVQEIQLHGRGYHFIKASSPFEMPDNLKSQCPKASLLQWPYVFGFESSALGVWEQPLLEYFPLSLGSPPIFEMPDNLGSPPTFEMPDNPKSQCPKASLLQWPYVFGFESFREIPSISALGIWGQPLLEHLALSLGSPLTFAIPLHPILIMGLSAEPPTEDNTIQIQGSTPLDELLDDIVMSNYLDYSLEVGHMTSVIEARSKIRTAWTRSPAKDLETLEIRGVGETETRLLRACKDGRDNEVSELVHHDLECLTWEPSSSSRLKFDGFRPIHWAVVGGHKKVIQILLNNEADFYSKTAQGWSVIHLAALFGRFTIMKWLIRYAIGDHLSSYDTSLLGDTSNHLLENPLHLAVSHVSLVEGDELLALTNILETLSRSILWSYTNHAKETPLHRLAASCTSDSSLTNSAIVRELLSYEGRSKLPEKCLDGLGRTVLWHAACAGSVSEIEHLIKNDGDALSLKDINGMTPLHAACRLGHTEVARALLRAGADPNATTLAPGLTAAHYAALYDHHDCLQALITYGAEVHKPSEVEEILFRPIHLAAANKHAISFFLLLNAGGDIKWRCTHYISRWATFSGDFCECPTLVECRTCVRDLLSSFSLSYPTLKGSSRITMEEKRSKMRRHIIGS